MMTQKSLDDSADDLIHVLLSSSPFLLLIIVRLVVPIPVRRVRGGKAVMWQGGALRMFLAGKD